MVYYCGGGKDKLKCKSGMSKETCICGSTKEECDLEKNYCLKDENRCMPKLSKTECANLSSSHGHTVIGEMCEPEKKIKK